MKGKFTSFLMEKLHVLKTQLFSLDVQQFFWTLQVQEKQIALLKRNLFITGKAVNREDKRSRRYRGRDFGISGKSRRYRDR